ncbi:alpha-glucoside ABC transporter substrate-binding protein [Virgisporangium aliadipatigenens]|uniref:Alpha-glucoside ABC transporter substrate-binding protein n=1 Tax=Virgisporangium aliadipatigenens TaxID=741659 RepID=A0A8J3YFY5_9ACTN|nr:alpha-glucoside ABC transporter substrate-binding protein [Virgisporangium aliadipatigenens]
MAVRKKIAAVFATVALVTAGCGADSGTVNVSSGSDVDCGAFEAYLGHEGTTVTLMRTVNNLDVVNLSAALRDFSDCTSIKVQTVPSKDVEGTVTKTAGTKEAPDLAVISQPGLIKDLASAGKMTPPSKEFTDNAPQNYAKDMLSYATVNGTLFAVPFASSVKSLVWYSPSAFARAGYTVPQTWADFYVLADRIRAAGVNPWCDGWESGGATGWPGTDWVEEAMLRLHGPEVYDQWIAHQLPFNDPKVAAAFDWVGRVLKTPGYVLNGTPSIAPTGFGVAGLPVLSGKCYFYRMAAFYSSFFPRGTKIGPDGDIFVFYNPPVDAGRGKPVEISGDYLAAFADRPEVAAVQTFMASADFGSKFLKSGLGIPSNNKIPLEEFTNPVEKLSVQLLRDQNSVLRFDASDLMPGAVGAGTFWSEITKWINGQPTATTVANVEASWPK